MRGEAMQAINSDNIWDSTTTEQHDALNTKKQNTKQNKGFANRALNHNAAVSQSAAHKRRWQIL